MWEHVGARGNTGRNANMISTQKLLNRIKEEKTEKPLFLKEKEYNCPDISIYLCDLLAEHCLEVRDAVKCLGIDRAYGYQMFNGTRKPTRNLLIRLAVWMGLSMEEANRLLKIGRKEVLYPRRKEDAAVIFAMEKKMSLEELDEILEELL